MEEKESLVSIVILNYNAGEFLVNCIQSVLESDYSNIEIIVVDNASHDHSQKKCKERFPNIKIIQNKKNLGYCEGNNIGLKDAGGEFLVVLNPDTEVKKDWLNKLFNAYRKFGDGLYQPKHLSLDEKDILMSTGNMLNIFGFGYARGKGTLDENSFTDIEEISYASGTCLFCSKKTMEKIGYLDPFVFLYHDDLDLGWRAAHLGIKSYFVPESIIYHAESYALRWNAKKFFWLERNRKYCLLTHYSKTTYSKIHLKLALVDFFVWMYYISKGFLLSKIRAELDIIKNRKKIAEKYYELEKKKIISDKEIIMKFPDTLHVPGNVSSDNTNNLFNKIIGKLSKNAKKSLID
tara:strand:+ start:2230 stop:3276 length:1047 start_codon:yes stop_codon:yes gene_type:complete